MSVDTKTVGQTLRDERESQNHSIDDVVNETKIRHTFIQAIENDDYSALPPGSYKRLYIKSYCKFLDIDASILLDNVGEGIKKEYFTPKSHTNEYSCIPSLPQRLVASILIVVVVFVFIYTQSNDGNSVDTPVIEKQITHIDTPVIEKQITHIASVRKEISIMANKDLQVHLFNSDIELIEERNMAEGDVFFIPEDKGLILKADNLDALQVLLDGNEVENLQYVDGGISLDIE